MTWLAAKAKLREFIGKYGKVAIGVHCTVSFTSIAGLYVAIKNNVDVESALEKVGFGTSSAETEHVASEVAVLNDVVMSDGDDVSVIKPEKKRNRTAEIAKSSGGALAAAVLLNKALFPVRVPITLVLTPPVARILARRSIVKNSS